MIQRHWDWTGLSCALLVGFVTGLAVNETVNRNALQQDSDSGAAPLLPPAAAASRDTYTYVAQDDGVVVRYINGTPEFGWNGRPWSELVWKAEPVGPMTYDEAEEYCQKLKLAGRWNWRLPTYSELKQIATRDSVPSPASRTGKLYITPPFDQAFAQATNACVWAYCPAGSPLDDAVYCFSFAGGGADVTMKDLKQYVLPVSDEVL